MIQIITKYQFSYKHKQLKIIRNFVIVGLVKLGESHIIGAKRIHIGSCVMPHEIIWGSHGVKRIACGAAVPAAAKNPG